MLQVHSLSPGRSRLVDSGTQTDSTMDTSTVSPQDSTPPSDSKINPQTSGPQDKQMMFNKEMEILQSELIAAMSKDKDDTSPNGNRIINSNSLQSINNQSFTPCGCEHCQLCPVAKTLARLTSSESAATDDNNKNLTNSMTTSQGSLPQLPHSVEETLHTLKMIANNNQQQEAVDVIQQRPHLLLSQHKQIQHHRKSSDSAELSDKWEAIEKVLGDDHHQIGSGDHHHFSSGDHHQFSSGDHRSPGNTMERRSTVLQGEKQPHYEPHHSFFVTQALQVGGRRAQVVETLSDEEDFEEVEVLKERPLTDFVQHRGKDEVPDEDEESYEEDYDDESDIDDEDLKTNEEEGVTGDDLIGSSELDSSHEEDNTDSDRYMTRKSVLRRPVARQRLGSGRLEDNIVVSNNGSGQGRRPQPRYSSSLMSAVGRATPSVNSSDSEED